MAAAGVPAFCWEQAQGLLRAKPQFEAAGFRLAVVSIGSPEGGREFCAAAPFPPEQLLLDGDHALHRHVGCVEGFKSMFSPKTWEAMRAREWDEFKSLLGRYKMIAPKTVEATAVMGGVWVLDGDQCLYEFKDSGPGVHAPLTDVLAAVKAA
ncbi:hypothetical protein HYH03_002416 [Edaphochlamys debaryana]|uniref:Uncharacterized protein n=1 Tax=Edaphochlamys debaryana TaxID=47281 RepID=A0A835YD16_9CHLO|nr:hypothetical protein HYH03_002416 [Edaphochlamys debaryana]|eukprot:KAG2499469.1 hypothetical protein HYH03_002416 [Edaphochlamys debaryana]